MSNWFETLAVSEFPAPWEEILQQRVPVYRCLPEPDRRELRSYIRWFIGSKEFEGCAGLVITDEIRVTVAAQACLLLLHRETPCYERLRLIRVYPGAEFFAVATECFFEKPRHLLKKHPNLYAELKQFYRQDPAAWCWERPEDPNQTLQ